MFKIDFWFIVFFIRRSFFIFFLNRNKLYILSIQFEILKSHKFQFYPKFIERNLIFASIQKKD